MKILFSLLLLLFLHIQAEQPKDEMDPPKVSLQYSPGKLSNKSSLIIQLEIEDGWHINSTKPADEYLFPLKLDVSAKGIQFEKGIFPHADSVFEEALQANNFVYQGNIQIIFPIQKILQEADSLSTQVKVSYQACSNRICLMPATVKATLGTLFQEIPSYGSPKNSSGKSSIKANSN